MRLQFGDKRVGLPSTVRNETATRAAPSSKPITTRQRNRSRLREELGDGGAALRFLSVVATSPRPPSTSGILLGAKQGELPRTGSQHRSLQLGLIRS